MSLYLYPSQELPEGFAYPKSFLECIAKTPIPYPEPWWFLGEFQKDADYWLAQVKKQYPDRPLVPFAKRSWSDDLACFDGASRSSDPKVYYVHTFAARGWEDRGSAANFKQWMREAEEESAEFKAEQTAES